MQQLAGMPVMKDHAVLGSGNRNELAVRTELRVRSVALCFRPLQIEKLSPVSTFQTLGTLSPDATSRLPSGLKSRPDTTSVPVLSSKRGESVAASRM